MGEEQEEPRPEAAAEAPRAEQERREEDRVPVYHETEARLLGESYRAVVRDLSRWGLMAECEAEFPVRSYVYVVLPGVGSLPGRVTWARDGRFGVNLLEPITDHHFEKLVRILPSGPGEAAA